jgi:hypothetical protein
MKNTHRQNENMRVCLYKAVWSTKILPGQKLKSLTTTITMRLYLLEYRSTPVGSRSTYSEYVYTVDPSTTL